MGPYTVREKFSDIIYKLLEKSGKPGAHDVFHGIKFYVNGNNDESKSNREKSIGYAQIELDNITVKFYQKGDNNGEVKCDLSKINNFNLNNFLSEIDKRIEVGESYKTNKDSYYSNISTMNEATPLMSISENESYSNGFRDGKELGEAVGYSDAMKEVFNKTTINIER